MKFLLLSFFLLPVFPVSAFCQATTAVVGKMPPGSSVAPPNRQISAKKTIPDYSAEPAVIERQDSVYSMNADGTGSRQATMAVRVQSEAAVKQLGVLVIPYAANSEHVEISYARVRRPNGAAVETPVTDAIDMPNPVTREAPFYSDLKQMELPIRSLDVGDTLEWQVKVVQTKAAAPGEFWGQANFDTKVVALSESVELHVPANIYVNVWSPTNKPKETEIGGERIFRWTASQTKPTVGKQADAERALKKKQVWTADQELDAKEGKLPTIAWTTFKSWEAVGAWYRGLEGDRMAPDAAVKAKVAELTANKATEEEKVRAVYGYVAAQIRYIGVAFGVGRYQPHTAQQVLQNQYGDCKDKGILLAAMLNALGLHPDAVLIGAGVRFNTHVPSPASFNHLINKVSVEGNDVWLDSTAEIAPYRALVYAIRNKPALVIPETGAAATERTPAALPFTSSQTMDAVGTLDKQGTSNSRIVLTVRGDTELLLRSALRQISPALYDQFVQRLSQGIGYAGTTSNAEVANLENTAAPLQISYDYKREKAGDWDHYKIIPQLAPVSLPVVNADDPPVRGIELGVPRVETSTSAMKLPDGWGATLPDAVHVKSPYATYDETCRFQNGTVYAKRRVEVLRETVPVADWKTYKKWTDAASLGNETYIQLTSANTGDANAKGPPAANNYNAEAEQLVSSAYTALQMHALDRAQAMLDKAKALNPEQSNLWAEYGYLAAVRENGTDAADDYKKEISIHPESKGVYPVLTYTYLRLHQPVNADDTLRKWAAADATNPLPSTMLLSLLVHQGKAAEAVAEGEAAIAKLLVDRKNDERLQLALGKAQMAAGMKEKGRATMVALLQATQQPGIMNDCSYELADANAELPLAESKARIALQKMDAESKNWNLNADPSTLLAKSRLIVATWDTVGWIFYRERKFKDSEGYLKAAWMNWPSLTIAKHLGELDEALGRENAALTTYELGLATVPHVAGTMTRKTTPGAEEIEVQKRVLALKKAGAKFSGATATQALQNLRTFALGATRGSSGSAQYWLLISGGTTSQAKAIGTDNVHQGIERVKRIRFAGYFPPGSDANLVRKGILFCGINGCQLVLEP